VVGKWHDQRKISKGHLLITVSIGQHELDVVIPPQIADAMMSRNYKDQAGVPFYQDDVKKLLTTGEVRCEVSLGGAGISLDELMSLQVGDVVKLNTSLNDPCDLKFDGTTDSVKCLLGKKDDHIAVKIVGQGV
jgi:flagellar motor switch protein FliM